MKRQAAKDLKSKIKPISGQINNTFQEKLQEIMDFDIQTHNEAITKYIKELQRKIIELEDPTVTDVIITNIKQPIEESIDQVTALSNLIQDLVVSYPVLFSQFSEFCKRFYNLGLNRENTQQAKILAEIASSLELNPIKLELWLTSLVSQKKEEKDHANNNTRLINKTFDQITAIEEQCPKNIDTIVLPKRVQYKSDPEAKPLERLLSEIIFTKDIEGNSRIHNDKAEIFELQIKYKRIVEYYKRWENRGVKEIRDWASGKKDKFNDEDICEAIAIMDRANELVTGGHRLRDTQILAVLVFLSTEDNEGKLCQIQTGEGKTTIASLLAVIKRLQGEKVDIITSNNILAAEGVVTKKDFYSLFDLSVATNNPDNNYNNNDITDNNDSNTKATEGPRACYRADIIYGSISNFQFDYLKDSFLGCGTRVDREFGMVILDEVDSMLVDNGRYIAKLANPFPGMESLRYVYIKIWQELYKAEQEFASEPFILDRMEVIKARIKASNPIDTTLIPKYLKVYAEKQLGKWINNALYAKYACHENQHYIIKFKNGEGTITPVDYMNTGVNLNNTVWPYALHQFLQLKHNLHLTTETLTNSHVSNMHYIKKYGNKIFGMTGTLGSNTEKSLLSEIYKVDHTEIPTYKEKRFIELPGIIVNDSNWLDSIILGILEQINLNRAVLVICETIQDVKIIKQSLELFKSLDKNAINTIKIYINEDDAKITKDLVSSREIIIATNIAGRGTDLETTEELKQQGGLHVCVSFLPSNQRVEDQAFGRTARQGDLGSGQLIIRESEIRNLGIIKSLEDLGISEVKGLRNEAEKLRVQDILDKVVELDLQDELFHCFSNLYQELREKNKHIEGFHFVLEDLKEYWAFWLEQQELKADNLPQLETIKQGKKQKSEQYSPHKAIAEQVFAKFAEEAKILIEGKKICKDGIKTDCSVVERIIHNPYHSIKQAEYFLEKNNLRNNKLTKVEDALKQATFLSGSTIEVLPSTYITLFEVEIERSWHLIRKFSSIFTAITQGMFIIKEPESSIYKANYKDVSREYLEKAKRLLEKETNYLQGFFKINNDFDLILLPESSKDSNQDMLNQSSLKASIVYKAAGEDNFHLKSKKSDPLDTIHKIYNVVELEELLHQYQDDINNRPFCIHYYNTSNNNQNIENIDNVITIFLSKDNDHITILYDDPLGNKMPCNIKWLFTKYCYNQQKQVDQIAKILFPEKESTIVPIGREVIQEEFTSSENKQIYQKELLLKNLLLKHLYSKLVCLKIQQNNIDELTKVLSSHVPGEVVISSKSSEYFQKIDPNKEVITNFEVAELGHVGLGNIYGLNIISEHSTKTFSNVAKQVSSGLSLLKTGQALPCLLPLMTQVAYILIAEGISDLTNELIKHKGSSSPYNLKDKIIIKSSSLSDETLSIFIEQILQYTIKVYQEFVTPEELPSMASLYEEIHNQETAIIIQHSEQINNEKYYDFPPKNEALDTLCIRYQVQDSELVGCDEIM